MDRGGSPAWTQGFWADRLICAKHDAKRSLQRARRRLRGQVQPGNPLRLAISPRRAKAIVIDEGLATQDGAPSWFYVSIEGRGDSDPLTNYAIDWIARHARRDAPVLVTGCGIGLTAFHFAELGFSEVDGIDLLPECVAVANRIKQEGGYGGTRFWQDDCFRPRLERQYGLITAMHWVFSAWMGNYGNAAAENPHDPAVRERLLNELLQAYAPHLSPGGVLVVELTDAVADYRLAADHPSGPALAGIYPVRHSPEQVARCADAHGLRVLEQQLCLSYGHQPRTSYFLERR